MLTPHIHPIWTALLFFFAILSRALTNRRSPRFPVIPFIIFQLKSIIAFPLLPSGSKQHNQIPHALIQFPFAFQPRGLSPAKKMTLLIFPFDKFGWHIKCEREMIRQIIKILKGQKQMEKQIKVEWDACFPSDQSENGRNTGSWSTHQNLLYAIFINQHKSTMVSKRKRKNLRIFDKMADFIVSRNSLQCRSHHQKLIEKFMEIKSIINLFKKFFGNQYFKEQSQFFIANGNCEAVNEVREQQNMEPLDAPQEEVAASGQKKESGECGEEEIRTPETVRPEPEFRSDELAGQCKMEQPLQYYYSLAYYFNNGLIQIPYFSQAFPACAYQPA